MDMSESDIFHTVKRVLAEMTRDEAVPGMGPETQLRDVLGIDFMTSLTLLMALEDTVDGFIVDPDTLDSEHFGTIGSVCRYVRRQATSDLVGRR